MCAKARPGRRIPFLLHASVVLLAMEAASAVAEGPELGPLEFGGMITGIVTAEDGITPIEDATVSAYLTDGMFVADTQTWEDGTYFLVVPADQYLLDAHGPAGPDDRSTTYCDLPGTLFDYDNFVQATLIEVVASDIVFGIDFRLVERAYITGRVLETDGTTPIDNATVNAMAPDQDNYTYDASLSDPGDGTYTLTVPAGVYVVDAWGASDTYFTQTTFNGLPGNINTRHNTEHAERIYLEPGQTVTDVDFMLDVGGTIRGTVTDSGANAVDYITVQAFDEDGMHIIGTGTDGNGEYSMNVAPGNYYVNARPEGSTDHCFLSPVTYDDHVGTFESHWSCTTPRPTLEQVGVLLTTVTSGINMELPPGGSISGTVRDATTGEGVRGAWVHPRDENGCMVTWSIQTDANGEYTFCGLKPDDYLLEVRPPDLSGYAYETYEELRGECWCDSNLADATLISLDGDEAETDIDFTLERLVTLTIRHAGEPDECIVAGATLTVDWISSEPAGNVTLELLQGDQHRCDIGSVPVGDGTFTWTVPTNIGDADHYVVRGRLENGCANRAEAQTGFLCITGSVDVPTLQITTSPGGATLTAGTPQLIEWTWTDLAGDVNVVLTTDGQARCQLDSVPVTDGAMSWTVPLYLGDGGAYAIRLEAYDSDCVIASDESEPFAITGGSSTPTLEITEPAPGVCLTAGSSQVIRWSLQGLHGYVSAELYDGDDSVCGLNSVLLEGGELPWTVPLLAGDGTAYRLRLHWSTTDCADPSWGSTDSAPFCITGSEPTPTITITGPTSGAPLTAGETVSITWEVDPPDTAAMCSIALGTTGAACTLGVVPLAAGTFDWTVSPFLADGDYAIQICVFGQCSGPGSASICSDIRQFSISGGTPPAPTITITSPGAGEIWRHNCEGCIDWTITPPEKAAGLNIEAWLYPGYGSAFVRLGTAPAEDGHACFTVPPTTAEGFTYAVVAFEGGLCEVAINFNPIEIGGNDADFDDDCDVDLGDFSEFAKCFNSPNRPPRPECEVDADFDDDSDVDLADFAVFAGCFNGPNRSPAASCNYP